MLPERYKTVTFDRATAIRNSQAEFLALGHPFVDAMLRRVGDYSVRWRVQREDGDEYLFDLHTLVVLPDGGIDERMAEIAASEVSLEDSSNNAALDALRQLESLDLDNAYQLAKAALEKRAQFWDWDEDVELIGMAKLVIVPHRD